MCTCVCVYRVPVSNSVLCVQWLCLYVCVSSSLAVVTYRMHYTPATQIHTRTHTHVHAHTHVTHTHGHTHVHTHTYPHTYTHTYTHTRTHIQVTHTHVHIHTHTRNTHTRTHTRTHTHTHVHTHTYTHYVHIHTRTHIHVTHTHTYTYTPLYSARASSWSGRWDTGPACTSLLSSSVWNERHVIIANIASSEVICIFRELITGIAITLCNHW